MKTFLAIAAAVAGLAATTAAIAGPNLVTNGGFDAPGGFMTDYAYRSGTGNTSGDPNSLYGEGTWTINTNPHNVHDLWIDKDFGNILILNGKVDGLPSVAWAQDLGVLSAGSYSFAFDLINIYAGSGASSISFDTSNDGGANYTNLLTYVTSPPGDAGVVAHQSGAFAFGGGTLRVSLRNNFGEAGGNDFGIDNISVAAVPEPATWAMMILGFGGVGALMRSHRRRGAPLLA